MAAEHEIFFKLSFSFRAEIKELTAMKWIAILTIFLSGIALLVSFKSCQEVKESNRIALESNRIAQKAVDQSNEALVKTERPYLNATIVMFKDISSFFDISREASDRINVRIRFKLTNTGRSPARSISVPGDVMVALPGRPFKKAIYFEQPPVITLGPEESQTMDSILQLSTTEPNKIIALLDSDKSSFVTQMVWFYRGIDDKSRYKTRLRVRIKKTNAIILDKQME